MTMGASTQPVLDSLRAHEAALRKLEAGAG